VDYIRSILIPPVSGIEKELLASETFDENKGSRSRHVEIVCSCHSLYPNSIRKAEKGSGGGHIPLKYGFFTALWKISNSLSMEIGRRHGLQRI
jgi:hypothetical protein